VARILPTVLVLALLGCTAAAFAVTEQLKLERNPITHTAVDRWVAPDSLSHSNASIGFVLRKPDRLTVALVDANGDVVRTLAHSLPARRGAQQFTWNGRDDANRVVPDGAYRPRVHLAHEHRTILLPNRIRMDATPPLVRRLSVAPRRFSPNGDFRDERIQIRYRTSEPARVILYVDGEQRPTKKQYLTSGRLEWGGKAASRLAAGPHRLRLRAYDLATNLGPPSRALTVFVRYVELRPHAVRAQSGKRFGFRVLTDAKSYSVHFGGLNAVRSGPLLVLRAHAPGRYVLRVAIKGHEARAVVVVGK
jgi:flagellar hook capping protein FlgD